MMIKNQMLRWAVALALSLPVLAGCTTGEPASADSRPDTAVEKTGGDIAQLPRNADGYVDISVDQLAEMMAADDFTLVNVHIPYEGELPDTDLFIPFNEMDRFTAELPDKNAPIVLYCRSGSMSTQAAKGLAGMGYTNIFELDGGFNAWKVAGHELLQKK